MENNFVRGMGAKPSTQTDYRTVPLASVISDVQFLNGTITPFDIDYSAVPIIDQGMEPECTAAAVKAYMQKFIFDETGELPDISTRALYQLSRMYGNDSNGAPGAEPVFVDQVAFHAGLISTLLVPEDRTLDPAVYGSALDVTADMMTDGVKKKIVGYVVPNLTIPELMNAIKAPGSKGVIVTMEVDSTFYQYVPGQRELDGSGTILGLHRVILKGFHVNPDGSFWFHGRNSWGADWGTGGEFQFNAAFYLSKMSEPRVYMAIPAQLLTQIHSMPVKPSYTFTAPFHVGNSSPDVKALQDILKYEGLFSLGTVSNGIYGLLTTAGVLAFQMRYAVSDYNTLSNLNKGQYVGPATIAKLNELYGSKYAPKIIKWAQAIQSHEGYFAPGQNATYPNGSLSWRNKNPFNFQFANQPNAINSNGWACFDTYQHGFDWGCQKLTLWATTGEGKYSPTMTILQFEEIYSPDGTAAQYAADIAARLGVTVDTPIKNLIA